ncbi:hypothetical protein LTR27_007910 [Elasticomyces elasticus]|nr:hypothetical protein LTR27_007910 [Elasticomyces elasticus]
MSYLDVNDLTLRALPASVKETLVMSCQHEMWNKEQDNETQVQHAKILAGMIQDVPQDALTSKHHSMLAGANQVIGSGTKQSMLASPPISPAPPLALPQPQFQLRQITQPAPTTGLANSRLGQHATANVPPNISHDLQISTTSHESGTAPGRNLRSTAPPTTNAAADFTSAPSPPQSNLGGSVAQGRDVVANHDMATSARKSAYFTNHEEFRLAEMVYKGRDSGSELLEGLPGRTLKCIRKHMQTNKWTTFYNEYCKEREAR